jgi:hypothetical protein
MRLKYSRAYILVVALIAPMLPGCSMLSGWNGKETEALRLKVLQDSQFVSVKVVDGLKGRLGIIAFIAEDFAHMGPVFLFDVGVIVFFVRASSGELDLVLIAEGFEVIVPE